MGHFAASAGVFGNILEGVMSYRAANDEADMLEVQADQKVEEGKVQSQIDINETVAETAAIEHAKGINELNKNIALAESEIKRKKTERENKEKLSNLVLTSGSSGNKFTDVFKDQQMQNFDKLVDFSFQDSQTTYQNFIANRELDRQASYTTTQGLYKSMYTQYKFNNQAITLRNQAASRKAEGKAALMSGVFNAASSYSSGYSTYGPGGTSGSKTGQGIFRLG
tara:strand:+ start:82 stop:753 length:672 start_codon:yes stop_codon:yes gene_type:complete